MGRLQKNRGDYNNGFRRGVINACEFSFRSGEIGVVLPVGGYMKQGVRRTAQSAATLGRSRSQCALIFEFYVHGPKCRARSAEVCLRYFYTFNPMLKKYRHTKWRVVWLKLRSQSAEIFEFYFGDPKSRARTAKSAEVCLPTFWYSTISEKYCNNILRYA